MLTQPKYMRIEEVLEMTGVTRSTLWRWQRKGVFPKLRQIGPGTVRFVRAEILDWVESRPVAGSAGTLGEMRRGRG